MTCYRFDIVIFNYERIESFLNNFHKIINFKNETDRITIVTTSPSNKEKELIKSFERAYKIKVRYLTRENKGIDQLGRILYFLGETGDIIENTMYKYIFQMQEHYLDTTSLYSSWGSELDYKIKGDVVPDNIIFDLNEIELIFREKHVHTLFCDRNNPCFFTVKGKNYIAPNGGNFIFDTSLLSDLTVHSKIKFLKRTFENKYDWAVFVEFFWGEVFFHEDSGTYDYKRKRYFDRYKKEDFYISNDDYVFLKTKYAHLYKKYIRKTLSPFSTSKKIIGNYLRYFKMKKNIFISL